MENVGIVFMRMSATKMGDGKLIINIEDAMQASLLEDLLFEIKSGEHIIDEIGWVSKDRLKPTTMTITFKEGKKKLVTK